MIARPNETRRSGFTLVELLIVIAIIGILAAILVPVTAVVITRTKEAKINNETKQLAVSIENYKNEFSVYPIDMSNPFLLTAHMQKVSRRNEHVDTVAGVYYLFNPTNLNDPNAWWSAQLPNPHINDFPNSPLTRTPKTMDPPEALVFFLSELSKNTQYPLGYRWDPNQNQYVYVPGERYEIHEFKDTQLSDIDGDGWLEYVQAAGPRVPYVYFDSRSYLVPDVQSTYPATLCDANSGLCIHTLDMANFGGQGFAQPYWTLWTTTPQVAVFPAEFVENDKFQIICAGMDGNFSAPYLVQQPTTKHFLEARQSYQLDREDLDNFGNFAEARLDKDYEQ